MSDGRLQPPRRHSRSSSSGALRPLGSSRDLSPFALYAPTESSCPALCEHHEHVVLVECFRHEDSRLAPEIGKRKFLGGDIGIPHSGVRNVAKWMAIPTSDFQTCVGHSISQMTELDQKAR